VSDPASQGTRVRQAFDVRAAAGEAPGRVALVEGATPFTFSELAERVARAAQRLRALGARPDVPVGLVAETREPFVTFLYALVALGVPVAPVHPRLRSAERRAVLHALGPRLVLEGDAQRELLAGTGDPEVQPFDVGLEHPLAIVATSGSSGVPKGVVLSRRAFAAACDASAAHLGWRDGDRWLLCMPPAHVGGLSIPLRTLAGRRATVCGPPGSFEPQAVMRVVEEGAVTLLSLVPTMLAKLLSAGWSPPPSLRAVLLGGAGAPASLLHLARERRVPVLATYGMTETCGQVTTQVPGATPSPTEGAGRPLPGVQVRVVDGEIQVRAPSLLSGYARPDDAAPLTIDGYLRTGDAGFLDADGRLHVLGRLDDRIISGGENVDPMEVEQALLALGGLRAACVFGVPDPTWGQVVAAALVPEAGSDRAALEGRMAAELAPHRRPRHLFWVDALPTTASGKVDRRAAAERALGWTRFNKGGPPP
jgi:o-succinylbenzoate---CoA ligase